MRKVWHSASARVGSGWDILDGNAFNSNEWRYRSGDCEKQQYMIIRELIWGIWWNVIARSHEGSLVCWKVANATYPWGWEFSESTYAKPMRARLGNGAYAKAYERGTVTWVLSCQLGEDITRTRLCNRGFCLSRNCVENLCVRLRLQLQRSSRPLLQCIRIGASFARTGLCVCIADPLHGADISGACMEVLIMGVHRGNLCSTAYLEVLRVFMLVLHFM